MKVHQAYFGDKKGSHNLIATSIDDKSLIGHLKLNTDIPASINISKPYLSAFRFSQYYIVTKTMNDESSERPGMGFSHCIIIPLELISTLNNLRDIIEAFLEYPVKSLNKLEDIDIHLSDSADTQLSTTCLELIDKVVEHTKTIVYIGYDNFEDDIINLWKIAPLAVKQNLSFTISGSPNEIESENFTLVHTLSAYEIRWTKYPMIKGDFTGAKNAESCKFLINTDSSESKKFYQFLKDNDIEFNYFHQYLALVKLFSLVEKVTDNTDITTVKRLINLLSELAPKKDTSSDLKEKILNLFTDKLKVTDAQGALLLRNMNFKAFENGETKVSYALKAWAERFINPDNESFFPSGLKVLSSAYFETNPKWWSEIIQSRLNELTANLGNKVAIFLWQLWEGLPKLINYTNTHHKDEQILFSTRKVQRNKIFYEELGRYSYAKGWSLLYAESVSYCLSVEEAIVSLIEMDKTSQVEKNLMIIKENVGTTRFFNASVSIDHPAVHKIAGRLAANDVSLLHNLDIQNLNWQLVWYESYLITDNISFGVSNLKEKLFEIISLALEHQQYSKILLKVLAIKEGNLFDYPRRKEVWNILDENTVKLLLDRTSEFIIYNFKTIVWNELEPEIQSHIAQDEFVNKCILKSEAITIKDKFDILGKLKKITDENVIEVLKINKNLINYFEAEHVANIIKANNLKGALEYVYSNRRVFNNFSNIVNSCKSMLSLWNQMWLGSSSNPVSLASIKQEIDNHNFKDVFEVLGKLGIKDKQFNRLREEYIAGAKGIDLMDLSNRLKTYLDSFGL